jgi:hypothetical protein
MVDAADVIASFIEVGRETGEKDRLRQLTAAAHPQGVGDLTPSQAKLPGGVGRR